MARGRLCSFCCLVIVLTLCVYVEAKSRRFGLRASTLHLHPLTEAEQWGDKFHIVYASNDLMKTKQLDNVDILLRRFRRDVHDSGSIETTAAPLNDSHSMLIVHWAGESSSVIIALAKPGRHAQSGRSKVFVSRDYGKTFQDITATVTLNHSAANIDRYYNSDQRNSHYIFTSIDQKCVFATRDYARTFTSLCGLTFRPKTVSLNPHNVNHILAFDEDDPHAPLYVSEDFGSSWRLMHDEVKSFFWGVSPYDPRDTVYVEEKRGSGGNAVLKSHDYFVNFDRVIEGVQDFELQDEYLFATKRQHLLGSRNPEGTLQFWVSYRRQDFVNAQFPMQHNHTDYYVADASEGQVLLCVVHNSSDTNLYISNVQGSQFSLSLERVVYFNPKGANKDTWLSYYSNETFADVHKVAGLRGIYIASQLIASNGTFSVENQRSLITYDKGGEWELLNSPRVLHGRVNSNCSKSLDCSLHLSQEFSRLYPGSQVQPILSRPSAPGILLASGTVGRNLKSHQDLFVSRDAGNTWFQVMDGTYQFSMADHGGVMLAAQQFQPTDTVYYSIDEGESWHSYQFEKNEAIRIYGILTEPGEKTTVFSIFGSKPDHHSWILYQLNVSNLFNGTRCVSDDYKDWSLPDVFNNAGCLLGQKLVYKRRIAHAHCFNGQDFIQVRRLRNCSCRRDDYECDYGYKPSEGMFDNTCVRDPRINSNEIHQVPVPCPSGTLYTYTRGYRRVAGDTCHGGQEHQYEPIRYSCPVKERSEFLLVSGQHRIQAVDVDHFTSEDLYTLPFSQSADVSAVAFDYAHNRLFFSTFMPTTVKAVSLNASGDDSTKTLAEADHVTALAYDWTADTLYWIDNGRQKIEMMRSSGYYRRQVLSRTSHSIIRMSQLILDPVHGWLYWLEDTSSRSAVMRTWMNGDSSQVVALTPSSSHPSGYLQGVALDMVNERLYVTNSDSHIVAMTTNGSQPRTVLTLDASLQRPGLIAIYKEYVVWINTIDHQLWGASVHWDSDDLVRMKAFNFSVTDLLSVSHTSQSAVGACSPPTAPCSQLCSSHPVATDGMRLNRTCLCGDDFTFEQLGSGDQRCTCAGALEIIQDGFCTINPNVTRTCGADQFRCKNGNRCIPGRWRCDRDDDCRDMSDETDCPYYTCPSTAIRCPSGKCIPLRWKCDFDDDCGDHFDEDNCNYPACSSEQFQCDNGRCIRKSYVCDLDDDCRDGTDERNCSTQYGATCHSWEFSCGSGECKSWSVHCNGVSECIDGSDEHNCSTSTTHTCQSYEFHCDNDRCVFKSWLCDGDNDCRDYSDERNCTTGSSSTVTTTSAANATCEIFEYRCNDGFCVSMSDLCDGFNDCGDWSDELFCEWTTSTTVSPRPCSVWQFTCSSGQCISLSQRCNNRTDCSDNSDELDCDSRTCPANNFECYESGFGDDRCIWGSWRCDGDEDCAHGEDERYCNDTQTCPSNFFVCLRSGGCIPPSQRCNGHYDCGDHSDEQNCQETCDKYMNNRDSCCQHGCAYLDCLNDGVEGCFSNDTSIGSSCSLHHNNLCEGGTTVAPAIPVNGSRQFFCGYSGGWIPMMYVCNGVTDCSDGVDEDMCDPGRMSTKTLYLTASYNESVLVYWSGGNSRRSSSTSIVSYFPLHHSDLWANVSVGNKTEYHLHHLDPITTYVISVYTLTPGTGTSYPSRPIQVTTLTGYPSGPRSLKVEKAMDADVFRLSWQPPAHPNCYRVHYTVEVVDTSSDSSYIKDTSDLYYELPDLVIGRKYKFKVRAVSEQGFGSDAAVKVFVYSRNRMAPLTVVLGTSTENSVQLSWQKRSAAVQYRLTAELAYQDGRKITKFTKKTSYTFGGLCQGQVVNFVVEADYGNNEYSMPSEPQFIKTKGDSLAAVKNVTVHSIGVRQVILNYEATAGMRPLTVYYVADRDPGLDTFFQKAQHLPATDPSATQISHLNACERYFFRMGYGPDSCPISNAAMVHTEEDDKGPPKHLGFQLEYHQDGPIHINLTWKAPCDSLVTPVKYLVKTTWSQRPLGQSQILKQATRKNSLSYMWTNVVRGESYTFKVRTTNTGAEFSQPLTVHIPAYPAPEGLSVIPKEHYVIIMWVPAQDHPKASHFKGYNVTIYRGGVMVETEIVTSTRLHHNFKKGFFYTVTVCVAVTDGPNGEVQQYGFPYYLSEPHSDGISKNHLVAIVVPICLVLVVVGVVAMVFVVRHRRLQRSFLAFANSHYNTRSGTTTFSSDLDDDEPMIQGFSDDEPLVLA